MAKYTVVAIIKGTVERDSTKQAEEQLWKHEFKLTEIVNPEILDVEEVDLYDTGKVHAMCPQCGRRYDYDNSQRGECPSCARNKIVSPLPCPFCGGEVAPYKVSDIQHYIQCYNDDCEVQPAINRPSNSEAEVIRRWNKRIVCCNI